MSSESREYSARTSSTSYSQGGTTSTPMMACFTPLASTRPSVDRRDHRCLTLNTRLIKPAKGSLPLFSHTSTRRLGVAVSMLSRRDFSSGRLGSTGLQKSIALLVAGAMGRAHVTMLRPGTRGHEPTILPRPGSSIMAGGLSSCPGTTTTEPSQKLSMRAHTIATWCCYAILTGFTLILSRCSYRPSGFT